MRKRVKKRKTLKERRLTSIRRASDWISLNMTDPSAFQKNTRRPTCEEKKNEKKTIEKEKGDRHQRG